MALRRRHRAITLFLTQIHYWVNYVDFTCKKRIDFGSLPSVGKLAQGPVSLTIFARNSNSMETSPCCNSVAGHQIATNCCTCHDSTAVLPCTKFCSYHCIRIEMRVIRNFHQIWIAMEKPLVKRGPGPVRQVWSWYHTITPEIIGKFNQFYRCTTTGTILTPVYQWACVTWLV